MNKVTHLFIKNQSWQKLLSVDNFLCTEDCWIVWNISWWQDNPRQILISSESDLQKYNLIPWKLRENITISWDICQNLESWDLLNIWNNIKIRITYPCEPCCHLLDLEWFKVGVMNEFEQYRGKLWYIIQWWTANIWDECKIISNIYNKLPNKVKDRFEYIYNLIPDWCIIDYTTITMLMWVAPGYVRAMPKYISQCPWSENKVVAKEVYMQNIHKKRDYKWWLKQ